MIVCICRAISDKTVRQHLAGKAGTCCKVADVYKSCADGQSPDCCSCIPMMKDMVRAHNAEVTTANLASSLTVKELAETL